MADPNKDESGKRRERGGYARYDGGSYDRGYGERRFDRDEDAGRRSGYNDEPPRRERRASKQEFDDGRCKVERKWEANGDYKEERKCKGGARSGSTSGYRH